MGTFLPARMDLESTVKLLEGLVHITVLILFGAAVWGLWKLTANKRSGMKVTIINEIGHAVSVRCPGALESSYDIVYGNDNEGWERMQVARWDINVMVEGVH